MKLNKNRLADASLKMLCIFAFLFLFSCNHNRKNTGNSENKQENNPQQEVPTVDASLKLTQLKVAGKSYPIQDKITVDRTEDGALAIEYAKEPSDAKVDFEPELQDGMWVLQSIQGVQTLKIKLSKGSSYKEYEVNVVKLPKVRLVKFNINGSQQDIGVDGIINCGTTKSDSVSITTETIPSDAEVIFAPELMTGNVWNIGSELGEKTLSIKVKKGADEASYTAKITRVDASYLSITKIKIGAEEKEQDQILSNMTFSPVATGIAKVEIETNPADAKVDWGDGDVSIKNYEWLLAKGSNRLKIKISRDGKEETYTLNLESNCNPIRVEYSLNNQKSSNIKDDFEGKEARGENPLYEASFNHVNIQLVVTGKLGKILINGNNINANATSGITAASQVVLLENGKEKEIEVLVYPKVEAATTLSATRLKFRALGNDKKAKAKPVLKIDNRADLPQDFLSKLEGEEVPLHKVHKSPAYLDVVLTGYEKKFLIKEIKINDEIVNPAPASPYIVSKEIELKNDEAVPVKVEFIPYDERFSESFKWTFSLQSGGKDSIPDVELHSINDVELDDLPKALTEHLTDGSNPLYKFDGKNAKVIISCGDTNKVKTVVFKMDGEQKASLSPVEEAFDTLAKYTYKIADNNVHTIEIEMKPIDEERYSPLFYTFSLQSSGNKLKFVPSNFDFSINGTPSSVFPEGVKNHLTDGTAPEHIIDGKKVVATLRLHDEILVEKIKSLSCSIAGGATQNVSVVEKNAGVYEAKYSFELPDKTQAHLLKMTIVPKVAEEYEELTYSLNLKSSGRLYGMPLIYGVNETTIKKDGDKISVASDKAIIRVQARMDIMSAVTIGKEGDEMGAEVKAMKDAKNEPYWEAMREVSLLEGGNASEIAFKINVTPKDADLYSNATYTIKITGEKPGNAKFAKNSDGLPDISGIVVEKLDGCDVRNIDDYGITKVRLTAKTASKTSKVRYSLVNLKGEALGFLNADGTTLDDTIKEKEMSSAGDASHESEEIYLFKDKPTLVKLYVVSGTETDNVDGLYTKVLNYMELGWDYNKPSKADSELDLDDFSNKAWGVIEVDSSMIPSDGKIHLLFRTWDKYAYPVVASDIAEGQSAFVDAKDLAGDFKFCYITTLDVSKLKTEPTAILSAKCHVKYDGADDSTGFIYTVKVKNK